MHLCLVGCVWPDLDLTIAEREGAKEEVGGTRPSALRRCGDAMSF
jgi:hypothetical protein